MQNPISMKTSKIRCFITKAQYSIKAFGHLTLIVILLNVWSGSAQNITGLEYYFDTDPGPGNGTAIAITGSQGVLTQGFDIPVGAIGSGFHQLGIRTQNTDGTWSLYKRTTFYVYDNDVFKTSPVSPLTDAEFVYDAELGLRRGTRAGINITPTGNPDEYRVAIPTSDVTCDIHDLQLSVKNDIGNYGLYRVADNIDVHDNLPPTIVVFPDIKLALDASGKGSMTLNDIDNGTHDDCELVSVALNQAKFDYNCANLGANTVIITATDAEDKISSQEITITVEDLIKPTVMGKDISLDLAGATSVTIVAADVDNGSSDNCSFSLSIDTDTFYSIGAYPVVLTITDSSGNSNTVSLTVTITNDVLGVEEFDWHLKDIKIHPNPVENILYISTELKIDHVEIYDLLGKRIQLIQGHPNGINTFKMSKGLYFLKIYVDDRSIIKRFIKQ